MDEVSEEDEAVERLDSPSFTCTISRLQCATSTADGRKAEEVRNCSTDEGRPLGTGLQEQVPNHLRRLCPKGKVVNAEGRAWNSPGLRKDQELAFGRIVVAIDKMF